MGIQPGISDYALPGETQTSAPVSREGSIDSPAIGQQKQFPDPGYFWRITPGDDIPQRPLVARGRPAASRALA